MFKRIVASIVCIAFISSNLQYSYAQGFNIKQLPVPGSLVASSPDFMPLTLKGLVLHPEDALKFDFLMDTGNSQLSGSKLNDEALKVMTYFLTALTMPEDDMWVNLSPYEHGKVIDTNFGNTLMGRDLLAEDYVLKQLTSSLIYPEDELGKSFWKELYGKMGKAKLTDVGVETINKVWIVPSEAVVWEHNDRVMIIKSHLRVMLEEDYLALKNNIGGLPRETEHSLASQTVRSIVLPVLEKQVNEGEHFAQLRQMYQAMILATWYKKALKESILTKVYADQKKIKGVDNNNPADIEAIYQQYLDAFKKGAFNYIKEDINQTTGEVTPRKYFSGGFTLKMGIFSLATALSVWAGTPSDAQAAEIAQAVQPLGTTVLVQGFAAEADRQGQPILIAQMMKQENTSKSTTDTSQVIDKKKILRMIEDSRFMWGGDMSRIVTIGQSAVPGLIAALRDDREWVRWRAVLALRDIGDKSAIPALLDALKDESFDVRAGVVDALGKVGDKSVVPQLLQALNDNAWRVRFSAVTALGNIGDKRAIPGLIDRMEKDFEPLVRQAAINSLALIGEETAVPSLIWALSDNEIREIAYKALIKVGKSAVPELIKTLKDKKRNIELRRSAINLLGQIGDNSAIPALREAVGDSDLNILATRILEEYQLGWWQRQSDGAQWIMILLSAGIGFLGLFTMGVYFKSPEYKMKVLNKLAERKNIEAIKRLLKYESGFHYGDEDIRRNAREFLSELITDHLEQYQIGMEELKSKDELNRSWAVTMLAKSQNEGVKAIITERLGDHSKFVRDAARTALNDLEKDRERLGQLSLDQIKSLYSDNKIWAIRILTKFPNDDNIERIRGLLNDSDLSVRNEVRKALNSLVKDSQAQYQLGVNSLQSKYGDVVIWSIGILTKLRRKNGIQLIKEKLKSDYMDVRVAVRQALDELVVDSEEKYQLGVYGFQLDNIDVKIWAIDILVRLGRKDAISVLVQPLENSGWNGSQLRSYVRTALDKLVTTPEAQYQLGLDQITKGDTENVLWAMKMLVRSQKKEAIGPIAKKLNEYDLFQKVRQAARKALDELVTDSQTQYQLGLKELNERDSQHKIWAVSMLAKSQDRRSIEPIAKFLDIKLNDDVDYELYNAASNALYFLGDQRSQFLYEYHPEEGHEELVENNGYPYNNWVVDKKAYWEKVKRSDAVNTQVPVAPVEEKWPIVDLVSPPEVGLRVRKALDNGRLELADIADIRLRRFMEFLKANKLQEIVIVGGAVRDAIAETQINDFDITVQVPLTTQEKGVMKPLSRETHQKSEAILARLAKALGVTIDEIKDESNPVRFDGVPIQYLGPGITNGPQRVVINNLIVDQNTGTVEVGFTGAEILFMGLDGNGKLFDHKRALENWLDGKIVMKGDHKEGHNMGQAMILKILRLRHQFGLAISDATEQLMRRVLERSKETQMTPGQFNEEIAAVVDNAIDKDLAIKELKEWGFETVVSSAPAVGQKPGKLGGIALDSRMLDLQIRRDGNGVPLPISQQPLDKISIQGFVPQIIGIIPVNLIDFLSLNVQDEDMALAKI